MRTLVIVGLLCSAAALGGTVYLGSGVLAERELRSQWEARAGTLGEQVADKDREIARLEEEGNGLKQEIAVKNKEITENRSQLARWEKREEEWQANIRSIEQEKSELTARLQSFNQEFDPSLFGKTPEGAPVEKPPFETGKMRKTITGKVILVNREYSFVVVGLGKMDGIRLADHLEVLREGAVISELTVSKLYDSLASCDMMDDGAVEVVEGDLIRLVV